MKAMEASLRTVTRVFRRECHRVLDSVGTTIQGADGMLLVHQLTMAEVNNQKYGDFGAALSEVLAVWKYFLLDKLQLSHNDISPPQNYDLIRKEYDCFLKRTNTVDLIDTFVMFKELRVNEEPEEPVTAHQMFQFLIGDMESSEKLESPAYTATPSHKAEICTPQIKRVVRRVFCSYLGLLINCKNDLAVAYTLNNPSQTLGHAAFTDLREAGSKLVSSIRAALVKGRSGGDPVYLAAEDTTKDLKERISHICTKQMQSAIGTGISPARPRAYAINHSTAYGGRDTVKVLMTLMDEEALAPPCRNKAELLSEDLSVLNGSAGACLLNLYKSPAAPMRSSPKPLRNRICSQRENLKAKVAWHTVRSQFACTYKDADLPLNRVLEFSSTSQLPTCVHPASKQSITVEEKVDPTGMDNRPTVDVDPEATKSRPDGPGQSALGEHRGNVWNRTGGKKTQSTQLRKATETSKRKLASRECIELGRGENQPPQKRPPAKGPIGGPGKKNSKAASRKLIAGQGKLTSFFRL